MSGLEKRRPVAAALALAAAAAVGTSGPTGRPASRPMTDLEHLLGEAATASSRPGIAEPQTNPLGPGRGRIGRADALPGAVVLSSGKVLGGYVYTTRDKNWEVWVESEKRWRHIPPILVLGIRAVVVEEGLDKEWRWKEMGSDEKIYTGRVRPLRRFRWKFHLIDDSHVTGAVKGQPLWVHYDVRTSGPFVLHERSAGEYGQGLKDHVYVRQVVISRRAMADALDGRGGATRPR